MIKGAEMTQTTLRETLEKNYEEFSKEAAPEVEKTEVQKTEVQEEPKQEESTDTTERPRNERGQFAPKEATKEVAKEATEKIETPKQEVLKRPSTWKKDYWGHWDKLTKGEALSAEEALALAKYNLEREGEFAKGVSTYKTEYERLRPIEEALRPYSQIIQQAGLTPDRFIHALAGTHQTLTQGSPEDKLRAFAKFAQDYQVPLQQLLVQGEDGKIYFNQNYLQPSQQEQKGITPEDVQALVSQQLRAVQIQTAVQQFVAAKDKDGNPLYPHFDEVKGSMDRLLRSGLAENLPSAYEAALKLPQHSDLLAAEAEQRKQAEIAEKARIAQEQARRAKANVVSVKSSTPAGSGANGGRKGLRELLESNFDSVASGRV